MKTLLVVLLACGLGMATWGCEDSELPPRATAYDESIDGLGPMPQAGLDPGIFRGRAAARPTEQAPTVQTTTPPDGGVAGGTLPADVQQEVNRLVADIQRTIAGPDLTALANFYVAENQQAARELFSAEAKARAAKTSTEQVVAAKLGQSFVARADEAMMDAPLEFMIPDLTKATMVGQEIHFTGEENEFGPVFRKENGQWRLAMPENAKDALSLDAELANATADFRTALAAGVQSGDITAENFDAKVKALKDEHMGPTVDELPAGLGGALDALTASRPASAPAETTPEPAAAAPGDATSAAPAEEGASAAPAAPELPAGAGTTQQPYDANQIINQSPAASGLPFAP